MKLNYPFVLITLLVLEFLYYRIAIRLNIIDKPNERSSHRIPTVRGGGIIFPISMLLYWLIFDFNSPYLMVGLVLIAAVSLLDDLKDISRRLRMGIQLIAILLLFIEIQVFAFVPWYGILILLVLCIGVINAVNFMDGINGITGLYGLVFVGTLLLILPGNPFFENSMLYYLGIALIVFLLFNFRQKKALMFAGDVGSISLAFIMLFFVLKIFLETGQWSVILLFLVYGVDSVMTIMERIYKKENIFKPHRSHLYQYLSNNMKIPYLYVAVGYALIQLIINYFLFIKTQSFPSNILAVSVLLGISAVYFLIKKWVKKNYVLIEI